MGTIKDFKYKLIKDFLSKEELEIGCHYMNLKHKKNYSNFDPPEHKTINADSFFFGDNFTETIMMRKLKKMEQETKLELYPTYSFFRIYTFNSELKKHTDRASCEISVTVMWESDGTPWPIYIEDKPIEMSPGDALIYLGCELEHWRDNFEGDYHIQSFLHYVDKNGPYKDFKYDKRDNKTNPEK